ncbi:MAG: MarR family transcriptional regulator [Corallococcus sp.]|nr:MarR family transcriptional regulator [Corallococcus sp.]
MEEKIIELTDMIFKFYPQVRNACRSLVSIKSLPVSMTQLVCLYTVEKQGDATMSCLADHMRMSNQQMTKVVDNLVKFELVERRTDDKNRRQIIVGITPKGAKMLSKLRYEIVKKLSIISAKLPEGEVDRIYDSFTCIVEYFEKMQRASNKHLGKD